MVIIRCRNYQARSVAYGIDTRRGNPGFQPEGPSGLEASCESLPVEVEPPPSPRKYWTRRGLAEWLTERLSEDVPTIVGIDHGFSFPLRYFEVHWLEPDWPTFLDDFQKHWPTDAEHTYVDFIRHGSRGEGEAVPAAPLAADTEDGAGAKSVFTSTYPVRWPNRPTPMPWLGICAISSVSGPLALRRLVDSFRKIRAGGGLSVPMEQEHSTGGPHARPT